MTRSCRSAVALALLLLCGVPRPVAADAMLSSFAYPHPVRQHTFRAQGLDLAMAYMDVTPARANGQTVVLLHGKNFCGGTWEGVIEALSAAGFRVIVPDQIGFCKSSKPDGYAYGLHELAANTHGLLAALGVERPIVAGHSMGGMLALRYALSFPNSVAGILLLNPIGLEDWRAKGVGERTLDELVAGERMTDRARIQSYQQMVYYDGRWKPAYDRWVDMLASMYEGADREIVVRAQAQTSRMIFSDPVVHELERVRVPVALMIGARDTTAIGRDRAPPDVARSLGDYPTLARETARRIAGARLTVWPDLGHSPHIEDPERIVPEVVAAITELSARR